MFAGTAGRTRPACCVSAASPPASTSSTGTGCPPRRAGATATAGTPRRSPTTRTAPDTSRTRVTVSRLSKFFRAFLQVGSLKFAKTHYSYVHRFEGPRHRCHVQPHQILHRHRFRPKGPGRPRVRPKGEGAVSRPQVSAAVQQPVLRAAQ